MPSGFQLRTAINDQFTHRPVLVTSWDGRCVPFPEHAYAEAGEADDGALDIVLSNWGAPRDSTDPIMLDIETHGGVYTDPRSSPDMLARIVQAVGRVKKLRPASNVGIFLTWTQSMAGAARTAAERTTHAISHAVRSHSASCRPRAISASSRRVNGRGSTPHSPPSFHPPNRSGGRSSHAPRGVHPRAWRRKPGRTRLGTSPTGVQWPPR
jgi:hypothetical protein